MAGAPILVVDDAPVNLKLMRLLLTHEGYEVRTAERAEDALEMLSHYRPELILTDLQMPGMDGLEMTRQVKQDPRTKPIRVVALTACAMKEDRERALGAGCDDYISKPINTAALALKVRELLSRPAAQDVAPVKAAPADEAAWSASGTALEELRRGFLDAGTAKSRRLLGSLNSGFDAAEAARQLHEWSGSAALLGYSEISTLARKAEEVLRSEPLNGGNLRVVLTDLLMTFAEMNESLVAPVPDYITEAASGKRIALIGLTAECADAMCSILERVKARPRLFEASEGADSQAIADCDLVVFGVRPETAASCWLDPAVPDLAVERLIYTGEQQDLMALPAAVRSRAIDFLAGHWQPQDVLLRLALALSRPASRVLQAPAAAAGGAGDSVACGAPARPRTAVSRPDVVLADDDGIVRTLLSSTLQNHGVCCRMADNGRDALDFIRNEPPQAAVLDVNMPGMTGYEVLAAIRRENIPARVILLTSQQQEEDILRGFNLGADDYVTKPFNPFELVARLKRLIQ